MNKMISQKKVGVILSYANLIAKNLVTFIYVPILLRLLGQVEYGLYQMANSMISSLAIFSMGFGSSYVRFYYQVKKEKKEDSSEIAKLNGQYILLFSCMALLVILGGILIIINTDYFFKHSMTMNEKNTLTILFALLTINMAVSFPSSVFECYIVANERFKYQRSLQLIQTFLTPLLTLPLVFIGLKSISIVLVQTVVTVGFLLGNVYYAVAKLKMRFVFKNLNHSLFKEISIFSFYIFLNQIIDQINWELPSFLLGIYKGPKDVAIFSVGNQIKTIFISLSLSLSSIFVPQINSIVSTTNCNKKLTEVMTRVGRLQAIILLFFLGGFVVLGDFFIKVWAGESYQISYYVSLLLIIPMMVPLIQNTGIEIQRAKNMHKFRSIVYFLFAILNILISLYLIPKYGIIGASIGTFITLIVANNFIMNWYYSKKVGLHMKYFWKEVIKIIPSFLLPTVILMIIKKYFQIKSIKYFIVFGLIYSLFSVVLFLLFSAKEEERLILKRYWKKFT
ncbi:oligosaccharide flippase family protein [Vagococcus carniphilus]|uniref:oligosaccharide flippase family protein n=1 Tax=Vagococcus carniphilus TaxID=218144 RepID=UPI0028924615|nr:oligosaccharide flippase family protein [Vagococcus carniphilus]MDT2815397.1 oligosaccharide flippase family protein [Vagococcus carniphilus]MDT2865920.1 oligosaccharide flippase family protein [Vagococcus carniphilus]